MDLNKKRYSVVKIDNYEQMMTYSEYTEWCIVFSDLAMDYYLQGGKKLYILIRSDMPRVPKAKGEGYPKDDYGLSLIAMIVDNDGSFECTSRWNSFEEPPQLLTREELISMLDKKDYEKIFGKSCQ